MSVLATKPQPCSLVCSGTRNSASLRKISRHSSWRAWLAWNWSRMHCSSWRSRLGMSPTVSKIKASAAGCGRARTAGCRRDRRRGRETDGRDREGRGGGEGCGGGDRAGAQFSGEGPRPRFLDFDLAGISRRGLDDARGPYMSRPSLRTALSCSSLPAPRHAARSCPLGNNPRCGFRPLADPARGAVQDR